ncbi:hypothetical protein [Nonlabens tegetincola]|uniref:hypothetical protein n=1 Tax=Nonlabens tegetincola TaxID=323273 RepID=UPI0030C86918
MKNILFISLAVVSSFTAQAQFGKILKKKVKAAIEKEIDPKSSTKENKQDQEATGLVKSNSNQQEYSDEEVRQELAKKYPNDKAKQDLYYKKYQEKKKEQASAVQETGSSAIGDEFLYLSYPFAYSSGTSAYGVDRVMLRRQMTDKGDNVDILPYQDPEYAWLRFLTTPDLETMSPEGTVGYEMVSGMFTTKVGPDRSQVMEFGTGRPVLVRGMLIDKDLFVVYAGSHVGGHAFNVPSYMNQEDITVLNIVGAGDPQLHQEWLVKSKDIVKEFEASLQENYKKAQMAKQGSIKMPSSGSMNSNADLLSFATKKVKETIQKDGAQLLKIHIESNDWNIVRNKYTGHIMYRWIKGAFTEKNKNNDCYLQGFLIKQPYTGSGYGSSQFGGVIHGQMPYGQIMNCDNAQ